MAGWLSRKAWRPLTIMTPIVAFLLFEPVDLLERRVISLWGYKAASYCPKFECILDLKRKEEDVAQSG